MSLLDAFPHTVDVKLRTRSKGTLGGSKDAFSVVSTGTKCWRQIAKESEVTEFAKRGISVTDKIYFTSDPNIDEEHILEISGDRFEARTKAIPDASAGLGVVYRVMAEITTTGSTDP